MRTCSSFREQQKELSCPPTSAISQTEVQKILSKAKLEAEVAMFSGKQGKTWNTCSGDSLQSGKQYGVEKGPTENHSDLRLELLRKSLGSLQY